MAEYAIILVGVILIGAGAIKILGSVLGQRANTVGGEVSGSSSGGATAGGGGGGGVAGGGGGGGSSSGGRGGGGGKVASGETGEKMSASSKVGVGGVGGAAGEANAAQGGGGGGESGGGSSGTLGAVAGVGGDANVDEGFTFKKWFGVGMLVAGLLAVVYVIFGMRRAKKAADAVGPGKDGKGKLPPGANLPPPPSIR